VMCTEPGQQAGNACYFEDINDLDGYCLSTSSLGSPEPQSDPDQPIPLCTDDHVFNNAFWYSFKANDTNLEIQVVNTCCIGGGDIGLQLGIYSSCAEDDCIIAENSCGSEEDKSLVVSDLVIGNIYYLYFDGCAGALCNFELRVNPSSSTKNLSDSGVKFFPNPAKDLITLHSDILQDFEVNIYDVQGRIILSYKNKRDIEIQDLKRGTYLLEILDLQSLKRTFERIMVLE